MTTAVVRELKRLSPHGITPVAPGRSVQSSSAHGQRAVSGRLVPALGVAYAGREQRR